jgi:excinuclease UvrABC nuclease subunit
MPFPEQKARPFTKDASFALNPNQLGCYGLFVANGPWVYVGKGDIRQRLLDHFNGDNGCITGQHPTHWKDVVTADADAVEKQLIVELKPHCNLRVG